MSNPGLSLFLQTGQKFFLSSRPGDKWPYQPQLSASLGVKVPQAFR